MSLVIQFFMVVSRPASGTGAVVRWDVFLQGPGRAACCAVWWPVLGLLAELWGQEVGEGLLGGSKTVCLESAGQVSGALSEGSVFSPTLFGGVGGYCISGHRGNSFSLVGMGCFSLASSPLTSSLFTLCLSQWSLLPFLTGATYVLPQGLCSSGSLCLEHCSVFVHMTNSSPSSSVCSNLTFSKRHTLTPF